MAASGGTGGRTAVASGSREGQGLQRHAQISERQSRLGGSTCWHHAQRSLAALEHSCSASLNTGMMSSGCLSRRRANHGGFGTARAWSDLVWGMGKVSALHIGFSAAMYIPTIEEVFLFTSAFTSRTHYQ